MAVLLSERFDGAVRRTYPADDAASTAYAGR
jgi:hypothetical protein